MTAFIPENTNQLIHIKNGWSDSFSTDLACLTPVLQQVIAIAMLIQLVATFFSNDLSSLIKPLSDKAYTKNPEKKDSDAIKYMKDYRYDVKKMENILKEASDTNTRLVDIVKQYESELFKARTTLTQLQEKLEKEKNNIPKEIGTQSKIDMTFQDIEDLNSNIEYYEKLIDKGSNIPNLSDDDKKLYLQQEAVAIAWKNLSDAALNIGRAVPFVGTIISTYRLSTMDYDA